MDKPILWDVVTSAVLQTAQTMYSLEAPEQDLYRYFAQHHLLGSAPISALNMIYDLGHGLTDQIYVIVHDKFEDNDKRSLGFDMVFAAIMAQFMAYRLKGINGFPEDVNEDDIRNILCWRKSDTTDKVINEAVELGNEFLYPEIDEIVGVILKNQHDWEE